jgi:hypothetical protein
MDYRISWEIQDGKLDYDTGRIVTYDGEIIKSNGPSRDHNDLITALASRIRAPRSDVASNASRFYWRPLRKGAITISPVRRIDEEWAYNHIEEFDELIDRAFDRR